MLDMKKRTIYRFYAFLQLLIIPINLYTQDCVWPQKNRNWPKKIKASVQLSDKAIARSQMSDILYLNKKNEGIKKSPTNKCLY